MTTALPVRLLWAVAVLATLWLMVQGLWAGIYFEPTGEALAAARHGERLVGVASLLLLAAAAYAVLVARWPSWIGCLVAAPALLCGGLTLVAPDSLLALLAVVVAHPLALGGVAAGLLEARLRARREADQRLSPPTRR